MPRALAASRVAGRFTDTELATYGDRWRDPARAHASEALYRTFLTKELRPMIAGVYANRRLHVPTRLVLGAEDALFKDNPVSGWEHRADDMEVERVPGAGHWLPEEAPAAVIELTSDFLAGTVA